MNSETLVYHLRDTGIISITKDQTEVQRLIDDGVLSRKRAANYHRRNILLSAISNYSDYTLFQTEFYILAGDRLVLLSDGSYNLIRKKEIRDLSLQEHNLSNLSNKILNLIESREIRDDYSFVACQI
ncbi:MAG: hypothetical protein L3J75_16980 [Methylococcaceae bacterium]|nr:hypothetical protein [Methylococcaceae bacterium]